MALSVPQRPFPEPTGPLTVFVPIQVDGHRYSRDHLDLVSEGVKALREAAAKDGLILKGKPHFKVVTVEATGDVFLMGQQEWS